MGNTTNALEKLLANTEMNKKEVAVCFESSLSRLLEITCGGYRYDEGITMKEFVYTSRSSFQVTFVTLPCI